MAELDHMTARAMVDAGFMPLRDYIERFAEEVGQAAAQRAQASPWPRVMKVRAQFVPQRPAPYRVRYQKMRA